MKKGGLTCFFVVLLLASMAQSITDKIHRAIQRLNGDSQMKHAMLGFTVLDAKTGKIIVDEHGQLGLAPASCQKLFTSAASLEILGSDYRYSTVISYDGKISSGTLMGNLHISGGGDPSLGSWRWQSTKSTYILNEFTAALQKAGINKISGDVYIDDGAFSLQPIPGGWIWEDIGNYYGAGTWGINWHENQYDLTLQAGKMPGDSVAVLSVDPPLTDAVILNQIKSGARGSGDNSSIYLPPYGIFGFAEGTIPAGEMRFEVSGAMPYAPMVFAKDLEKAFASAQIQVQGKYLTRKGNWLDKSDWPHATESIFTHFSPNLDSLNFWFLKKSINMFGEVLIKTIAYERTGLGTTEKGVELIKDFWALHGIERGAINIQDGSGLSPQNRVTTDALVKVLQFATSRPWFHSFYESLPEINGMKMKSGSIAGARSFAGYQKSTRNNEFIFAIIVNNYDGASSAIVKKIWSLLDILK
jgi:serine-type D-Ala-D-Ala carboxypeptidase/endopeptidase (penicillin-binding protein 4)